MRQMTYELWDLDSGNCQGVYSSLLEALQVVRDAFERDGAETLKDLVLLEFRPDGDIREIAKELDLMPLIGAQPASRS